MTTNREQLDAVQAALQTLVDDLRVIADVSTQHQEALKVPEMATAADRVAMNALSVASHNARAIGALGVAVIHLLEGTDA